MSYKYEDQRAWVFTDDGQRQFLSLRDRVKAALKSNGCILIGKAISGEAGDTWNMLACIDRLVELGEIRLAVNPVSSFSQDRIIVPASEATQ